MFIAPCIVSVTFCPVKLYGGSPKAILASKSDFKTGFEVLSKFEPLAHFNTKKKH